MKDKYNIDLLKMFFKVEDEKVFPEEVLKAFKWNEERKWV